MTPGFSTPVQTSQVVAIQGVDAASNTATGYTRRRTTVTIDLSYHVGAVQVTPSFGEQWFVKQVNTVKGTAWVLDSKIPFNSIETLTPATEGQSQIGNGNGPVQLHGTQINANAPLRLTSGNSPLPAASAVDQGSLAFDANAVVPTYSDGNDWVNLATSTQVASKYALPTGGIPPTDLSSTAQAALTAAQNAYQKPSGGVPSTDLSSSAQAALTAGNAANSNWTAFLADMNVSSLGELATQLGSLTSGTDTDTLNWTSLFSSLGLGDVSGLSTYLDSLNTSASQATANWNNFLTELSTGSASLAATLINDINTASAQAQADWNTLLTNLGLGSSSAFGTYIQNIETAAANAVTTGNYNTLLTALFGGTTVGSTIHVGALPTGIPQSYISGLSTALNTFLTTGNYNTLLTALFGSSTVGSTVQVTALPTGIPQNYISGLTSALSNAVTTGNYNGLLTALFGGTSVGTTVQLAAIPTNIPQTYVQNLSSSLTTLSTNTNTLISSIFAGMGGSGSATSATIQSQLNAIFGSSGSFPTLLNNLFGVTSVGTTVQVAALPTNIPQNNISGLVTSLSSLLGTTTFQALLDGIANAFGHLGTGHSVTQVETYLGIIPPTNVANVLGGANLGADLTTVNTTTNTNATRAARKAQNDAILADWLHTNYPLGTSSDTAATLVGGKRTWWGAWNDNLLLLGQMLGIATPTTPASDVGTAVITAQTAATNAATAASTAQTAAGTAQTTANTASTAAGTAQTTANTAQTQAARKAQNDTILGDWLHATYPLGSSTDTAATLVGGKRTWWGAWNDNLLLLGQMLGITPPTTPASDVAAAVTTAQTTANTGVTNAATAQSAATTAQTGLNTTNTNLFGSTTPASTIQQTAVPTGIPATKVANVLGGSSLGADVSAVNTAAGTAQTTANTAQTRASRKAQNDLIIGDWLHQTYPLGSGSDTAATLVGGKRTWWGAWNDNLTLLGQMLGITAPTDPASDINAVVTTAQTTANSASTAASTAQTAANAAQSTLNTTNTNLFGSTTPGTAIQTAAVPSGIPATKIAAVLGGSNLGADVSSVSTTAASANTAAGTAQTTANTASTAAGTAQTTANTANTRAARKAQNDLIIGDWFHTTYPLGTSSDTAATLVGGKRTWWGAWNDNMSLLGTMLGITPPTDPASDINAAVTTAQTTANSASTAASTVQTGLNATNTNLFGSTTPATTIVTTAVPTGIPATNLQGASGEQTLVDTFNNMYNQFASAFNQLSTISGVTLPEVAEAAQTVAQQASNGHDMAITATNTLAIRNNSPTFAGMDNTTQSNIAVNTISTTTPAYAGSIGASVVAAVRCQRSSRIGALVFPVRKQGSPTNKLNVNLFRVDYANSMLRFLYSFDATASVPTAAINMVHLNLPGASNFNVAPGDVILVEFAAQMGSANSSTGFLLYGTPSTGVVGGHPSASMKDFGGYLNNHSSGGYTPTGDIALSAWVPLPVTPYVGLEISTLPNDFEPPKPTSYLGASTHTHTLQSWLEAGDCVDLTILGAGGGGEGELGGATGYGGTGGSWATQTLVVGTDVPVPTVGSPVTLSVVVGAGGALGPFFTAGGDGTASTVTWHDPSTAAHTLTGAFGFGGNHTLGLSHNTLGTGLAPSPQTKTFPASGTTAVNHYGGADQYNNYPGNAPGGAGAGGSFGQYGTQGADGQVWLVERQT